MSSKMSTYKNYHGSHEELLTKNNYEMWAPNIKRELEGKDQWGYLDGTRTAPTPLPANSPATDQLLFMTIQNQYRTELSTAGSYTFNACSKSVQDCYLYNLDVSKPKVLWDKLKEKQQGNNEESRSKLLSKFMTMEKSPDTTMDQFCNKLKRIQTLLNGEENMKLITDKMIIKQLCNKAGPAFRLLTTSPKLSKQRQISSSLSSFAGMSLQKNPETKTIPKMNDKIL